MCIRDRLRYLNRMNDYVKDCRVEGSIKLDGRDIYADYNTTLLRPVSYTHLGASALACRRAQRSC